MKHLTNQTIGAWKGNIPVFSFYTAGIAGEEFFKALKERGELMATRCNRCEQTYAPARLFCERCFDKLPEQVKVGPSGELVTYTIVQVDHDGNRLTAPIVVGAVRLEGATTTLVHRILASPDRVKIGAKVRVSLLPQKERRGHINDIRGFELA